MSITPDQLMTLQACSLNRQAHRPALLRHRRERRLDLGPCMRLQFEDERTVRQQIQEMLHAERSGQPADMGRQTDTYAHRVPDGSNWKATLHIELPDAAERAQRLATLSLAVRHVYVEVPRHPRVFALTHVDPPHGHRGQPGAVHVLTFSLPEALRMAVLAGATTTLGCSHDHYTHRRVLPPATIERLRRDLVVLTHRLQHTADGQTDPC